MKLKKHIVSMQNTPKLAIVIIILVYIVTNFTHHNWTRDKGPDRGVIKWDVISYYAYLPAVLIYGDVGLDFTDEPGFVNDNKFWYYPTEQGGKLIITTMGLSFLYAPFFLMAHALAPVFGEPRSGFSSIYQFFLVFSALVYLGIGLSLLKKILLKYFEPPVTAFTILLIGLGTNLYNYSTYDASLAHSYNFTLIIIFLYLMLKWYDKTTFGRTLLLGLVFGLLTLIRPTNILVLVVFILWGVGSGKELLVRPKYLFNRGPHILLMMLAFLIVWLPQLFYWKMVTGQFLFYSYGPHGDRFFFDQPHILDLLFSYRKGWLIYTPIMFFALTGFLFLERRIKGSTIPFLVYIIAMIYIQASWWTWWFGGGFGSRVFVDCYGLLALPLAALISYIFRHKRNLISIGAGILLFLLMLFQVFQTQQYVRQAIHWAGMTKEAYWAGFMKMKPPGKYWQSLSMPDSELARKGIYVSYLTGEDITELVILPEVERMEYLKEEITKDKVLMREIRRYAKRESVEELDAIDMVAARILEEKLNMHNISR